MGVWDFKLLSDEIKKWQRLADTPGISERDREIYLSYVRRAQDAYERYAERWELNAAKWKENPNGQRSE